VPTAVDLAVASARQPLHVMAENLAAPILSHASEEVRRRRLAVRDDERRHRLQREADLAVREDE